MGHNWLCCNGVITLSCDTQGRGKHSDCQQISTAPLLPAVSFRAGERGSPERTWNEMDMLRRLTVWPQVAHRARGVEPMSRCETTFSNPLVGLVDIAAQRLQSAEPVAALKFKTGAVITDSRREQEVIDTVGAHAVAAGIDHTYVKDIFRDQIDATVTLEHNRFAQWRLDPTDLPDCVPELSACRAIIDVLNRIIVKEMALQWRSLRSTSCRTRLEDARNIVIDARHLDRSLQEALAYATQKYCR
jgi:chorismate mutase